MRNYQSIEMVESLVDTKKVGARMKESVRSRTDLTLACGYLEDALEFRSQDVRRDAKSMKIYRFFWSSVWQSVRIAACWLFISLGTLDVPWRAGPPIRNQIVGDALCVTIFCIDATMRAYFTGLDKLIGWKLNDKWFVGFIVCLAATVLDLFSRNFTQMQWSGCLRPFIILYYSESSRISFMVSFFGAVRIFNEVLKS